MSECRGRCLHRPEKHTEDINFPKLKAYTEINKIRGVHKMKRNLKQVLAVTLTLILLITAVPFNASATTTGKCGDALTWTFNNSTGELKITGTGEMHF